MVILLPAAILLLVIAAMAGGGMSSGLIPSKAVSKKYTGRRSSDLTSFDLVDDVVVQSPTQVQGAVQAKLGRPVAINTIALATSIASESSGPLAAQIGIGWSIKNYAAKGGKSVLATVAPDGKFAAQGTKNHGYVSSARPPTSVTIKIAEDILATPPKVKDPTGGAIQFDSPKTQRALLAQGRVSETPEQVAANRIKSGRKVVYLPGVPTEELRFWV